MLLVRYVYFARRSINFGKTLIFFRLRLVMFLFSFHHRHAYCWWLLGLLLFDVTLVLSSARVRLRIGFAQVRGWSEGRDVDVIVYVLLFFLTDRENLFI